MTVTSLARRRPARAAGAVVATAISGLLLGWVTGALARPALASETRLLPDGQHPAALRYALAVMSKDPAAVADIREPGAIADRARERLQSDANKRYEPLALSYLGSGSAGDATAYLYVFEETDPDVGKYRSGLVVTVVDGIVVRQRP